MQPATSAVVVSIDRLGAGWLGPYGNTWLDTPHFNRLAARSALAEFVLADAPPLAAALRAWWTGRHALQPAADSKALPLPALAASAGARTVLVTDDPEVANGPLASTFAERRIVPQPEVLATAAELEDTGLMRLFGEAAAAWQEVERPALVWIHARGLAGPWDAPRWLREQFADEDDPPPPDLVTPPERHLPPNFDPDELLGVTQAYAGQVALLDACLGLFMEAFDEHPRAAETLLAVTSPRGYPLGEHLRIGPCDEALYSELLHVPLLVQFPQHAHALVRSQRLVQPHDLFACLADACGWRAVGSGPKSVVLTELLGEPPAGPDLACAVGPGQRVLRTPAWLLRESRGSADDEPRYELFAKPDDRWEANEVASRCGEVVELLAAECDRFAAAAGAGALAELPPLAEVLCDVWR